MIRHKELSIVLYPHSADADLFLLDSKGNTVKSSENNGTTVDSIVISVKPGTYFIKVVPGDTSVASDNTNFKMTVDTLESPPHP